MVYYEGAGEGRRTWMLKSASYYHDNISHASLDYDDISKVYKLSVVCDLKNYEAEIEWFLDWIAPHVKTTDLAGYVRYEEHVSPELIWFRDGKAQKFTPILPPEISES